MDRRWKTNKLKIDEMSSVWTSKYIENLSYPPGENSWNTKKTTTREEVNIGGAEAVVVFSSVRWANAPLLLGFITIFFSPFLMGVTSHSGSANQRRLNHKPHPRANLSTLPGTGTC